MGGVQLAERSGHLTEALAKQGVQKIIVHPILGVGPEEGAIVRADVLEGQLQIPEITGQLCCTAAVHIAAAAATVDVAAAVMSMLAVASVLAVAAALCADLVHMHAANQCGCVGRLGERHLLLLGQLPQLQTVLVDRLLWR